MPPPKRRPDTSWLPTVVPTIHGPDPRFRLTPLGGGRYGLSLFERNRWDPLPYEGTLQELVDVLNNDLGAWAADWPASPA